MKKSILISFSEEDFRELIREEISAGIPGKETDQFQERLTRQEVARFLGIKYQTVYHWVRKGLIKEYGFGKKKYFLKSELIEAMERNRN